MNLTDLITIGIIAVFVLVGLARGLMLSVFSLGSYFLAIIVAVKFSPLAARLISKTMIFGSINTKVTDFLNKTIASFVNDTVDNQIDSISSKLKLSAALQKSLGLEELKETSVTTSGMIDTLGERITNLIILVIAFIIVYIVAKILLFVLSDMIRKTAKLPVIRSFDKLGGALFGFIEGVIVIWVVFLILFMFRASDFLAPVFDKINESKTALFLYKNNLLLSWISSYLAGIGIR